METIFGVQIPSALGMNQLATKNNNWPSVHARMTTSGGVGRWVTTTRCGHPGNAGQVTCSDKVLPMLTVVLYVMLDTCKHEPAETL